MGTKVITTINLIGAREEGEGERGRERKVLGKMDLLIIL